MDYLRLRESISLDLGQSMKKLREELAVCRVKQHIIILRIECITQLLPVTTSSIHPRNCEAKSILKTKRAERVHSTHSWTLPYNKPFIKNHDIRSEPLGRIREAEFKNKTPLSGLPGVIVIHI